MLRKDLFESLLLRDERGKSKFLSGLCLEATVQVRVFLSGPNISLQSQDSARQYNEIAHGAAGCLLRLSDGGDSNGRWFKLFVTSLAGGDRPDFHLWVGKVIACHG